MKQKLKYYFWLLRTKSQAILLISVATMTLLQVYLEVNEL